MNDTIGETKDCETSIQEVKQAWLFQLFILMLYVKASITLLFNCLLINERWYPFVTLRTYNFMTKLNTDHDFIIKGTNIFVILRGEHTKGCIIYNACHLFDQKNIYINGINWLFFVDQTNSYPSKLSFDAETCDPYSLVRSQYTKICMIWYS